jgi:hypothetical protein
VTLLVGEIYDALRAAGIEDGLDRAQLATKANLAELKADLLKWNVGTLVAMTGIFAAIVKWL